MCRKSDRYSPIGDEDLDAIVLDIQRCHPNAGCRMMMGHVRSRDIHIQSKVILLGYPGSGLDSTCQCSHNIL